MTMNWHRLRVTQRITRLPVSGTTGFNPADYISIAHGVHSGNIEVTEEAQDRDEIRELYEQTFPERSTGR